MKKLGRNDSCHCGSGKKYKHCCLENDKQSNVVPIVKSETDNLQSGGAATKRNSNPEQDLFVFIERLPWESELYRILAKGIIKHWSGRLPEQYVAFGIMLWHYYSNDQEPNFRKMGVFWAALEYVVRDLHEDYVTQAEVAKRYEVSVSSLATRVQQLDEYAMELLVGQLQVDDDEDDDDFDELLDEDAAERERSFDAIVNDMLGTSSVTEQATPDYYNELAVTKAKTLEEARDYYRQGIEAGTNDLGPAYFRKNKGYFWGLDETRPFMRSKSGYAEASYFLGDFAEAESHFADMLALNPNDNQGVRYLYVNCLILLGKFKELADLLDQHEDDEGAHFSYPRFLLAYYTKQPEPVLRERWKEARASNPYVPAYILGRKRLGEELPDFYGFGDENEAISYIYYALPIWQRDKPLISWVKKQATAKSKR
ncbi:SEC-C metal-binding domain-containing protein [Paenibacillus sp. MER TA 81-3]|uniref:SEC-C metal-binding domain-containing protein n=1 Tax=Paenibacillus sp. MER TA 81-3 TaxID=2939573 RepID=UPI0020417CD7|nr:SEC-C metal-binding domain-containing protein [Paenibacillus sp. MER TA 81-3]MCM3337966.1 SEC-C metal-binding domain-containing protein [Paenibacillus sp. MER TA 81-3]